jgi:hypothetical protein
MPALANAIGTVNPSGVVAAISSEASGRPAGPCTTGSGSGA